MIKDILQFKDNSLKPEYLETINRSLDIEGKSRQLLCFVEELAEALQEILKEHLDFDAYHSELVDVVVCVEGIKMLYNFTNQDFDTNDYELDTIEDAILNAIVASSHFDRGRITAEHYRYFLKLLYITLYENLRDCDENYMDELLDKKFAKFKSQLDEK